MNRRQFVTSVSAALSFASATDASAGWFRRRRRPASTPVAKRAAHCPWTDRTMITFLVAGKFSDLDLRQEPRGVIPVDWHVPAGASFYWTSHDQWWCSNYGSGTVSIDGLNHFAWDGTANPTEAKILAAAEKLRDFYLAIRGNNPNCRIRLVGHSAGCNVVSFVTHLLAELETPLEVEQLFLLSPPVFKPSPSGGPHGHFPNHFGKVFPRLNNLVTGRFDVIRPQTDPVLDYYALTRRIWKDYDHEELRRYGTDANIRQVPDHHDECVLAGYRSHWSPCVPENWRHCGLPE